MDYWDYLGWKDTFGARDWSLRQERYRRALKLRNRWTPQLLVDNRVVKAKDAVPTVDRESKKKPQVAIEAQAELADGKIKVALRLRALVEELALPESAQVLPVLFQRRAKTVCDAGENKGKTLEEFFAVVRTAKPVAAATALAKGAQAEFPAPKGVAAANLGVAILVEDPTRMKTLECRAFAVTLAKTEAR